MRKLTRASTNSPSNLKYYIVHETLHPRLVISGNSGLHQSTNRDFCRSSMATRIFGRVGTKMLVPVTLLSIPNTRLVLQECKLYSLLVVYKLEKRVSERADCYGFVYDICSSLCSCIASFFTPVSDLPHFTHQPRSP